MEQRFLTAGQFHCKNITANLVHEVITTLAQGIETMRGLQRENNVT